MRGARATVWGLLLLLLALGSLPRAVAGSWAGPQQPVRFAPEHDYGPFVFVDAKGQLQGLSVELLQLLNARLGLQLLTLPAAPLAQQLEALRLGQADLISSLRPTPERGRFLLFTRPYVRVPVVLVGRQGSGFKSLAELRAQPVAVGQGYAVQAVVQAQHPGVAWQAVPDDAVGLRGVLEGRYAAAVLDRASFAHLVRSQGWLSLREAGTVDFEYALAFAVRRDWPELRDALDEALRKLPAAPREAILRRWMELPPELHAQVLPRTPWASALGLALLGGGLLLGLWLAWRRRRGQ